MDLSVVIVTYNSVSLIQQCLSSLMRSRSGITFEIIVVDNASIDNTVRIVKERYPDVRLIENNENAGFGKASNIGARVTGGKTIVFLNPDTVVEDFCLDKLHSFIEKTPEVGIVAPRLLYPDGTLQLSCRKYYKIRTILINRSPLKKFSFFRKELNDHLMFNADHSRTQEVDWLLGACLAMPRKVMEKVGCFDERYRLYFEDVDLCRRVKSADYKVIYYPEATVIHHHQRESARRFSNKTIWHIQSAVKYFNRFGWVL